MDSLTGCAEKYSKMTNEEIKQEIEKTKEQNCPCNIDSIAWFLSEETCGICVKRCCEIGD